MVPACCLPQIHERSHVGQRGDSLVQAEAPGRVPDVLLGELPVFNGPFHKSGHHDEAEDQDVDTSEYFVDHG